VSARRGGEDDGVDAVIAEGFLELAPATCLWVVLQGLISSAVVGFDDTN
jgi:hypothetical protein